VQTYTLTIDSRPDIRFNGTLIGAVSRTQKLTQHKTHLYLYKSAGGRYICYKRSISRWENERIRSKGLMCKTFDDVIKFFGNDSLARSLYEKTRIVDTVEYDDIGV